MSLKLIEEHVSNHVPMHQLYANISSNNFESISLFKKNGYSRVGVKKDWVFYKNKFNDYDFFDPAYPFGCNELYYNNRWYDKGGFVYVVRNCFIQHRRLNSWVIDFVDVSIHTFVN